MAHEVTNVGNDRDQLANMAGQAKAAMGVEALDVLADRGYFSGEEVLACEPLGVTPYVPKPLTSGAKAKGRFGKQDFVYRAEDDVYRCPAGETLTWRFTSRRGRHEPARLLDDQVRRLPAEGPMHQRQAARGSSAGSMRR